MCASFRVGDIMLNNYRSVAGACEQNRICSNEPMISFSSRCYCNTNCFWGVV